METPFQRRGGGLSTSFYDEQQDDLDTRFRKMEYIRRMHTENRDSQFSSLKDIAQVVSREVADSVTDRVCQEHRVVSERHELKIEK